MRRWFLSYHSPDLALAERLKAALERKDTDARVFFAPSSLRAGGFWSRALADEIAQADAFILLVGERGGPLGPESLSTAFRRVLRRAFSLYPKLVGNGFRSPNPF